MFEGLVSTDASFVILFIALLVFGPKKLPELGKGLGEGIRSFKNSLSDGEAKPADNLAAKTEAGPKA